MLTALAILAGLALFSFIAYRTGYEEGRRQGYAIGYDYGVTERDDDVIVDEMTMDELLALNTRITARAQVIMDEQELDDLERLWRES